MIRVFGRVYPLPFDLMGCPTCRRGELRWDEKWAWRCTHTWNAGTETFPKVKRCGHGVALSALFDDAGDLSTQFQVGKVNLGRLTLTNYARVLASRKLLPPAFYAPVDLDLHLLAEEDAATERAQLERLIREKPLYRRCEL